ncbi:MAG: hypothetical protein K5778_05745 [Bacteroidaceae bacterium]|nr:hypothetical protein [Bacteroidaceae bacterium]
MNRNLLYGITVLLCTLMSVSQAKADDYADYLTAANGFTEVTTVDGLKSGSNYYYVFQSAEDPTLALYAGKWQDKPGWASDGSWSPRYTDFAGMPLTDLSMYFQLEYGSYSNVEGDKTYTGSGFGMKSAVNTSNFFQTHGGAGWMWVNTFTDAQVDVWDAFTPTYADGSWTFYVQRFDGEPEWFNGEDGIWNYCGPWDNGQFTKGMAIAANKSADDAAHFKIYRISKTDYATLKQTLFTKALYSATSTNPVNATYRITNASFETGDLTGWTPGGDSDYPANAEIGAKPSVTSDGDGQFTFNTYQWWAESLTITQTATVPSGIYDITAVVATWENRVVTFSAGSQTVTSNGLGDMTGIPVSIPNLTVGTDNSLQITGSTSGQWWVSGHEGETQSFFKLDNVQLICKGVYLAGVALPLPNDDTTILVPGQWYYYDAAELGNYQLVGNLTNMVFTQNSNQIVGEGVSSRPALQKLTLDKGRVCFMTTESNATLKITSMSGEGATYDFSIASLNVDGLPESISFVTLNPDGPQAAGTRLISQYLANKAYDLIAVQEDFNFDSELKSSLTNYGFGTHRANITASAVLSPADTDGLNFFWNTAKGRSASNESWTRYAHSESGDGNQYIQKGWRYYEATLAEGIKIDVYMTHMDAGDVTSSRNIQWTELANAVIANKNTNRPKIILGDFNSRFTREAIIANFFNPVQATGNYTVSDAWVEKTRSGNYPSIGADAAGEVVDKIIYLNPTANGSVLLTLNSYTRDSEGYTYGAAQGTSDTTPLGDHAPVVATFTATAPAVNITPALDRWTWKGETRATTDQKWYLYNVQYGTTDAKTGFLSRNTTKLVNDPNESGVYPFKFSTASGNATLTSDTYKIVMSRSGFITYTYSATLSTSGTATSLAISQATSTVAKTLETAYHFNWSSYTRYFGASSTTALAAQTNTASSNAWALISTDQVAMYNRFVLASDKAAKYVAYLPIDETVKAQMITLLEKTGVTWTDGTTQQLEALNAQVEEWFDDPITITSATTQTVSGLQEGFYKVKAKVTSANKQTVTLKMGNWEQTIPMTGTTQVDVELPLYYHSGEGSVSLSATATGSSSFTNLQLLRYDSYYDETIGTAEYATTAIRYNTDIPAGVEVYYVDQVKDGTVRNSIHLAKYTGTEIKAGEGVILYKSGLTANTPFRFYRTNETVEPIAGNMLQGAVNRIEVAQKQTGTYYVLSKKSVDGEPTVGFFKLSDTTAVPAHRAYLLIPEGSSVKAYVFSFNEEEDVTPTAVQQIETDAEATVTGIYSLNGARQQTLQRGMNIVRMSDGSVKKILVK